MDIQEQAISKKQQMMDFCVGKTLEILKESIETRAEHLSDDKMDEVEQKEYDRAMEELTQTYVRFPAVQHIKDYLHLPDYIWQSDFLENLTMEQKRKWYHQPMVGNYSDFCNDNTTFDNDCPLFSAIYKVVVNEKTRWQMSFFIIYLFINRFVARSSFCSNTIRSFSCSSVGNMSLMRILL